MRKLSLLVPVAALAVACSASEISDAIEGVAEGTGASALTAPPDPQGSCDPALIADHVATALADLAAGDDAAPERGRGQHFGLLAKVYDADASGTIEESERAAIVADFTLGCAAREAKFVEEFDTDGDGALSEEERQAAHDEIEASRPRRGHRGPPPEGADGGTRPPPPAGGERPPRGEGGGRGCNGGGHGPRASLLSTYDADDDGTLSAAELETARAGIRARIVAGEPPIARPPPPAEATVPTDAG